MGFPKHSTAQYRAFSRSQKKFKNQSQCSEAYVVCVCVCVCVCVRVCVCMHTLASSLSRHVQRFAIPWTVAHQSSLPMGFSMQEY